MADQADGAQTTLEAPTSGQTEAGQNPAATPGEGSEAAASLLSEAAAAASKEGGDDEAGKTEDGGEKPKTEGPPEKYEFTLPEGMALDEAALGKFEPVLRDVGLTNEQANKLAGVFAEIRNADLQASQQAYAELTTGWRDAVKADPEIGGAKFDASIKMAGAAMAAFAAPELHEVLNNTGLGNHPAVVRFMTKVGAALQEDKTAGPAGAGGGERSLADRLYGSS
jgi:hypothetical protein